MEAEMRTIKKFWRPPSFEDFNVAFPNKKMKFDSEDFEEKMEDIPSEVSQPKAISQLAVHSKKIEEVRKWMKCSATDRPAMLLVTGPSGCGKTATIKASANEEGVLLKEWINPVDKTEFKADSFLQPDLYDKFNFCEEKQIEKFEDFIFRSSRYNSLFEEVEKTVILVEDIPNIFLWKPKVFHNFLEKYRSHGKSPIVFIMTDDQNLNLSGILFPTSIKIKLCVTNIKFNPVNHSCLVKNLKSLSEYYCNEKISSQFLENISRNSNGDIRSATNDLLLFLRTNVHDFNLLPKKNKNKNKNMKKNDGLWANSKPMSAKDLNPDFYHILGRILYPKIMGEKDKEVCDNPNRIFHHDVKKIAESWNSSFLSVLHQNYLGTYGRLVDVVRGAQCFSYCDILEKHEELKEYSSLFGVITLMLRNTQPRKTGFNPIKKSFQCNSGKLETGVDKMDEFCSPQLSRRDLNLDLIPLLKVLRTDGYETNCKNLIVQEESFEEDCDMIEIEEFED